MPGNFQKIMKCDTRVKRSAEFLKSWDEEVNPFMFMQPEILNYYDEIFGKSEKYYAIDNSEWPPKGLYVNQGAEKVVFATVAVSLRPQPKIEMYFENTSDVNRIELGVIIKSALNNDQVNKIASSISGMTAIPWDYVTFLAEGHTVGFQTGVNEKFNFGILTNKLKVLPEVKLPQYRESNTTFLWVVPISSRERAEMIESGVEGVLAKLDDIGEEIFSLNREEVV